MYRGFENEATWAYAAYLNNDLRAYRKYRVIVRNLRLRYGDDDLLNQFTRVLEYQSSRFTPEERRENPYLKRIREGDWSTVDYEAVARSFIGRRDGQRPA